MKHSVRFTVPCVVEERTAGKWFVQLNLYFVKKEVQLKLINKKASKSNGCFSRYKWDQLPTRLNSIKVRRLKKQRGVVESVLLQFVVGPRKRL